ncbi:MAG TPA: hypothetical protein [Caudoviricetes sp.]|nr:MAG TPA: hypothetical protein [Caudoviricetes sp.]
MICIFRRLEKIVLSNYSHTSESFCARWQDIRMYS